MSGTAFNTGQLAELSRHVNAAIATVLPDVAAKFDPSRTLRALQNRTEVLSGHLGRALTTALTAMFTLTHRGAGDIVLEERHEPLEFYQTRKGLWVWDGFRSRIASRARPTEAGAKFAVDSYEIAAEDGATDEENEAALPAKHIFSETDACAFIAAAIALQPNGESGLLDASGVWNLIYTSAGVVGVVWNADGAEWDVLERKRDGNRWDRGGRVLAPAN
jgi:hypothetical protein